LLSPAIKTKQNQITDISKQRPNYYYRYVAFIFNRRFLHYISILKYRSKFRLCNFLMVFLCYVVDLSKSVWKRGHAVA
jgi:uncharacterized membrane protein YecN with MAPEG domain